MKTRFLTIDPDTDEPQIVFVTRGAGGILLGEIDSEGFQPNTGTLTDQEAVDINNFLTKRNLPTIKAGG